MFDMRVQNSAQPTVSRTVCQRFLSSSVLTWGALATSGNTGQSLETLRAVAAEGTERAQDAAKYSATCRSVPTMKSYPVQCQQCWG